MQRIYDRLQVEGRLPFRNLFQPGMHRSGLVSVFLASMELIRLGHALGEQEDSFHEIAIFPHPSGKPLALDDDVSAYEGKREAS